MDNPGNYTLFAGAITTALSAQVQTPIANLEGIQAALIVAELLGGTGGTSISGLVQTSFDGGTTWLDVARFDFTNAPGRKYATIAGLTAQAVTSYAALAAEGVNAGLLGNRWRAVPTSVGVYTNTTFSLRLEAR